MEARQILKAKPPIITSREFLRQVRWQVLAAPIFASITVLLCTGCDRTATNRMAKVQVHGASMAPSIWGPTAILKCSDCQISWRANWQREFQPKRPVRCWNCGASLDLSHVESLPGESIEIDADAYAHTSPQPNDIVAVHDDAGWRIKRVAAVPGDIVDIDPSQQLIVNRIAFVSNAATIAVHDDRYRSDAGSWWQCDAKSWQDTDSGFKVEATEATPATLIYHHRTVYDQQRADVVRDDCIFNLNENRELRPVQRLVLELQVVCQSPCRLEAWFYATEGRCKCKTFALDSGTHALRASSDDASGAQTEQAPVQLDAFHPVIIRLTQGQAELRDFVLSRPAEYRIDPADRSTIPLPITLAGDEYFLVGDNVPYSIDSRYTGPVKRSQIRGKVVKVNRVDQTAK